MLITNTLFLTLVCFDNFVTLILYIY